MQTRELGKSGIKASVVGFGAWAIGGWMWGGADRMAAVRAIQAAIDHGTTLIDTAPIYGFGTSEEIVGEAIRGRRNRVILATKCGLVWHVTKGDHFFDSDDASPTKINPTRNVFRYLGPESIRYEIEQSLRRLKTEYIDLYQTHWQESATPIPETMEELLALKKEGKIRAIGVSNVTVAQLDTYRSAGPVDSDQEKYSMLDRGHEADLLPYCAKHGLAFLAYSPLAQGLLTGKLGPDRVFRPGDQRHNNPRFSGENLRRITGFLKELEPIASDHGATISQIVLAWTLSQPGCSHVLAGARTPEQAIENAGAGELVLAGDELKAISAALGRYESGAAA